MENLKSSEGARRFEDLLEYFERGKVFTEELMKENERLRMRVLQVEKEKLEMRSRVDPERLNQLLEENRNLRHQIEHFVTRFDQIEKENKDFANRYLEVQAQNDNLLNLYVSSYQLHSTLDPNEVVQVIQEIILNLIGAEEYLIYMVDPKKNSLTIVAGEGPHGPVQEGSCEGADQVLAQVLREGKPYFRGPQETLSPHLACTPLKVKDDVVGAISITKLMEQKKEEFSAIDHELLGLLSDHSATALVSSNLYSRTERKLRTVESFMELLKVDDKKKNPENRRKSL
jgi:hypothetical protein